jgi:hypothetical protein
LPSITRKLVPRIKDYNGKFHGRKVRILKGSALKQYIQKHNMAEITPSFCE